MLLPRAPQLANHIIPATILHHTAATSDLTHNDIQQYNIYCNASGSKIKIVHYYQSQCLDSSPTVVDLLSALTATAAGSPDQLPTLTQLHLIKGTSSNIYIQQLPSNSNAC